MSLTSASLAQSSQGNENLKKAPNFEITSVNGETISLQESLEDGKPMVVYFTASWCPKCAQNWPALSEVYPEYKDRLNLVAVSIDPTDDESVMRNLSEENGFTFPVTKGIPNLMVDFGVERQATTVGVNRDGYIAVERSFTVLSADEYRELFDQLLSSS